MEPGTLKPILTALVLPPMGPLWLVLAGLVLIGRRAGRRRRTGVLVATSGALLVWAMSCNGMAVWLAASLLPQVPLLMPEQARTLRTQGVQGIVVLGGGVQLASPEFDAVQLRPASLVRLNYGVWLARQSGLPLGFSGGVGWAHGSAAAPTEADAARHTSQAWGVPLRWAEDRSRDTAQNARESFAQLAPEGVTRIALVTHAWHMPRAQAEFAAAGFTVTPAPTAAVAPVERSLLEWLPSSEGVFHNRVVLREWLALRLLRPPL